MAVRISWEPTRRAATIPGTLEGELFDNGGAEVAYHDTTAGSYGQDYDQSGYPVPSFRQPTDVDIFKGVVYSFSNSYLVMMHAGDWMKYSVNVAQSGSYTVTARLVSSCPGRILVRLSFALPETIGFI